MAIECGNIGRMICSYLRIWKLFCSKLNILGRQVPQLLQGPIQELRMRRFVAVLMKNLG